MAYGMQQMAVIVKTPEQLVKCKLATDGVIQAECEFGNDGICKLCGQHRPPAK